MIQISEMSSQMPSAPKVNRNRKKITLFSLSNEINLLQGCTNEETQEFSSNPLKDFTIYFFPDNF